MGSRGRWLLGLIAVLVLVVLVARRREQPSPRDGAVEVPGATAAAAPSAAPPARRRERAPQSPPDPAALEAIAAALRRPPARYYGPDGETEPSSTGGLTVLDLLFSDEPAATEIQRALAETPEVQRKYDACFADFRLRLRAADARFEARADWSIQVTVVAHDGEGRFTAAVVDPQAVPSAIDRALADCYAKVVLETRFRASHDFVYDLEYPYALVPRRAP